MTGLKIKSVELRNWMKFKHARIDFPEYGLVAVVGKNQASGGALKSVGAGKSSFGEAVSRTLFGVTGRFTHLKQCSTDKKGDTYVKVEAVYNDKLLVVEHGYKCKELNMAAEALRFHYDGATVERGLINQTRSELSKLLGISPMLASWSVFVDGESLKFNRLSQADCVDLVMASLRQPPWNMYYENAKNYMNNAKKTAAKDEALAAEATGRLSRAKERTEAATKAYDDTLAAYLKRVEEAKKEVLKIEEENSNLHKQIDELGLKQSSIKVALAKIESDKAVQQHDLEIRLNESNDVVYSLNSNLMAATSAHTKVLTDIARTEAGIKEATELKLCPTCRKPLDKKCSDEHVNQLKEKLEALKKSVPELLAEKQSWLEKVTAQKATSADVVKKLSDLSAAKETIALRDDYEANDSELVAARELLSENSLALQKLKLKNEDAEVSRAKTVLDDRIAAQKEVQEQYNTAVQALSESNLIVKLANYWNTAFSPTGIPNMVLKEAIAPLNHEVKRLAAILTGGTIDITFGTARELVSGVEKAKLTIEVENKLGCCDFEGSSKGESNITNFIVAETLSEVGQVSKRAGYVWFDEVIPNQDSKVCHSVYSYLKEKAEQLKCLIFVVDHSPVMANYADYVLSVEKIGSPVKSHSAISWA